MRKPRLTPLDRAVQSMAPGYTDREIAMFLDMRVKEVYRIRTEVLGIRKNRRWNAPTLRAANRLHVVNGETWKDAARQIGIDGVKALRRAIERDRNRMQPLAA